jgi:diguanylate cyclase (GGDEF)-like protein/PAS domain S-box-containing protein
MAHIGTQLGRVVERKRAEQILVESELKFRSVAESASDAIISADSKGNIIFWNKGALDIFGYTEEETLGRPLTMLMPERYRQRHVEGMARVNSTGKTHVIGKTVEMHGLRKDGSEFPIELSLATWTAGEDIFYSGVIRDITERKEAEAEIRRLNEDLERRVFERTMQIAIANKELENEIAERRRAEEALVRLATYDELTGLYNRREMNRILTEEINRCMRYDRHLSLVMLDIDHFKSINDTHGHQVGDDVLRWIAGLLSGSLRVTDKLAHYESLHNLARYGGEEFAAILPETEEGDAFMVAERIRQTVAAQPFTYTKMEGERVEIAVTISMGVASLSDDAYSEETLIKAADEALYEAKRSGRNRTVRARTGSASNLLLQNALYEQPSTMRET